MLSLQLDNVGNVCYVKITFKERNHIFQALFLVCFKQLMFIAEDRFFLDFSNTNPSTYSNVQKS